MYYYNTLDDTVSVDVSAPVILPSQNTIKSPASYHQDGDRSDTHTHAHYTIHT